MTAADSERQVALVTGASRGIGAVIASRLARAGIRVGVNYNTSAEAAEKVVAGNIASGGDAFLVVGDVSLEESAAAAVKMAFERWGRLDILVNNAGIHRDRLLLRMATEDWDQVMNVDLKGAFLCTKFVMPYLLKRRRGRIVNISSVVGLSGNPGQANYAAAKAGLIGFTKSVAREVASRNITVNAIAPGFFESKMTEGSLDRIRDAIERTCPLGRIGRPEEMAGIASYLASRAGAYTNGAIIPIDGGTSVT